ncbi:SDR family oxidoreductase [Mucilaginibacter sp. OK098]|uniref:SDR family oxidoreductase n=1 Tax=Mucilaginibacter sp. OK098 TaxID=1855297 RepID=UPI000917BAFC|nr:SDR family oxidoreductase [Mucilaginibacter sp. OK098]SHN33341.1 NAD(P)-dependent dehydrogenase, short-chain alcohol dehydrogenase family [Mucilaginibacter sp. OK098]
MENPFKNKKIIIAGGSSGIGLAAAGQFKDQQAQVTITGRNPDKLKNAAQTGLQTAVIDSSNREALDSFFKSHGPVDHLVISLSGSKGIGNFAGLSLQVLREGFEEKYWPILNTVQSALPFINQGGSITLVTAISATAQLPGTSGLAALNGALEIMVPVWAKEIPQIRINAVSPGVVDTAWWDFLPEQEKRETFKQYAAQIPAGRVGKPDEIANAILFLAGNEYMTGKVIGCDGGMSL